VPELIENPRSLAAPICRRDFSCAYLPPTANSTSMETPFPSELTQSEIDHLFPRQRPPIKIGCFEIGLVLGGTVSAGAYTAGVLDYLIEALDAWTRAKEEHDAQMPTHEVIISTIAGASGGAIYGGVFLRAAGFSYPHEMSSANPFFDVGLAVDLLDLLAPRTDEISGLAELLNSSPIEKQTTRTVAWIGNALGQHGTPIKRTYLSDPLRLFVTLGNLRGIPYTIRLSGQTTLQHELIGHADFLRFGLSVPGGVPNDPKTRPDEIRLDSERPDNWQSLRAAALASSAFPGVLRSRSVQRSLATCGYRVAVIRAQAGPPEIVQLIPRWDILCREEPYREEVVFAAVDGGAFNNQPIDVVRTALAGFDARNERSGAGADRAVILVDPFSDPVALGPRTPPGLLSILKPFFDALIYQARFKPEDIALAERTDVYSRFLIAPYGPGPGDTAVAGSRAIASGGLGGFLGFVHRSFLHYDYQLGRRNAYEFLRRDFVFPENNQTFFGKWTDEQKELQREADGPDQVAVRIGYLPMIPLVKRLRESPPPRLTKRDWPRLGAMPAPLAMAIEGRLIVIYKLLTSECQVGSWGGRSLIWIGQAAWTALVRFLLRDRALDVLRTTLRDRQLLP
jgi:predicted acylesterase/phospholipase RssA